MKYINLVLISVLISLITLIITLGLAIILSFIPSLFQPVDTILWVSNGSFKLIFVLEILVGIIFFIDFCKLLKSNLIKAHV